jgi:citrate synthase
VIEQHDDNRLIRPRAEYTGPAYPAPYVPMAQRSSQAWTMPAKPSA